LISKSFQLIVSLDVPVEGVEGEEYSTLLDSIQDDGLTVEEQVATVILKEDLKKVLASLGTREKQVLELRYGLDNGKRKELEEIGRMFNLTRERIRQIEAKALRKLRHRNRNNILKGYFG